MQLLLQCKPVGGVVQEVDVSDKMFTTHDFDLYSTCKGKRNPKLPERTGLVRTDYEGCAVRPSLFLSIARYVYMHAGVYILAVSARTWSVRKDMDNFRFVESLGMSTVMALLTRIICLRMAR